MDCDNFGIMVNSQVPYTLVDSRNIFPANDLAIPIPIFAVLPRATLKVTGATMQEDDDEEDGVEVGDDAGCADDGAPS